MTENKYLAASAALPDPGTTLPKPIDLRDLAHALLTRWKLLTLIASAVVLAMIAYLAKAKTIYESTVVLQIEQQEQKAIDLDVTKQDLTQLELLKTIEANFANQALMKRVITAKNLASNPDLVPGRSFLGRQLHALKLALMPPPAGWSELDDLVDYLLRHSGAKLRRGTRLIDVTFEHPNPDLAREIANAIVQESIQQSLAQRQTAAETASYFLLREAESLRTKLEKSEQALQNYKEETGSASLGNKQNIVTEKLREISSELTRETAARLKAEADYAQGEALSDKPEALLAINSIALDPSVVSLLTTIAAQEGEVAKLAQRYTREHPKMVEAQSQVEDTRRSLREAAIKALEVLRNTRTSVAAREKSMELALQEQEKQALALNRQAIDYDVLSREMDADRELYHAVLAKVKETNVAMGMQPLFFRIVDPATLAIPVKPRRLLYLVAAILGGLILGAGTVVVLNFTDTAIHTVDQAEEFLSLPVLAAVPRDKEASRGKSPLETVRHPDSLVAEAFRSLRTSLVLLGRPEDRKSFAVTSALPSEGKTFVSGNLAVCFAQQGLKTLLIDADLRRPAVEALFFDTADVAGLREYLTGQVKADEVVRETSVDNLYCISAGGRAPNPAELLAQSSFHALMREASAKFDRIVIDTAPVNVVSDTLVLAKHVQTICIVVNSEKTPRKAVRHALDLLRRIQAPVAGIVLNRLPLKSGMDYFYHYSSHEPYGRDGVYEAEPGKAAKPPAKGVLSRVLARLVSITGSRPARYLAGGRLAEL